MNAPTTDYSYPAAYYRTRTETLRSDWTQLIVSLFLIAGGSLWAIRAEISPLIPALLCAVGLFLGWIAAISLRTPLPVGILSVFARPVARDRFTRGEALARNSGAVDDLTRLLGLMPLSAFGYDEAALPIEADIWFSADDALPTVRTLIGEMRSNGLLLGVVETPQVLSDLEVLEAVLSTAADDSTPFRFLLRYSNAVCHCHPVFQYGYI